MDYKTLKYKTKLLIMVKCLSNITHTNIPVEIITGCIFHT